MKEQKDRNIEIYNKWIKGSTQFKLAIEYDTTPSNIARIINSIIIKYGKPRKSRGI